MEKQLQTTTTERNSRPMARRAIGWGALCAVALGGVTGCEWGPNYSGKGNRFVVSGHITSTGDHSITAKIFDIETAEGEADGWFDDNDAHQVHDNYYKNRDRKEVGDVVDLEGKSISPRDLDNADCVEFTGAIRDSKRRKSTEERPVYELARQIPCPENE